MPSLSTSVSTSGPGYSSLVGFIYVFNLIVGTGALTMPKAFTHAGWLLSLILVILLAFTSYLTVTFVIESMAAANAVIKYRLVQSVKRRNYLGTSVNGEEQPLLTCDQPGLQEAAVVAVTGSVNSAQEPPLDTQPQAGFVSASTASGVQAGSLLQRDQFEITNKVELGEMASLFFNKVGVNLFYICTIVYLYGDLAVYAAAVPKSMRDIVCTYRVYDNGTESCNVTLSDSDPCWDGAESLNRMDVYRIFVTAFCVLLGPFTFFNVQKTKYLQLFTTLMRWLAFTTMVVLATIRLAKGEGRGSPPVADFTGVPTLFGVCVYSFMCHHSLPSLVTPIRDKTRIHGLLCVDYVLILGFYALLSFTGIFTFHDVRDLYTLNFEPDPCSESGNPITNIAVVQYFLALFPVFTISASFPIIAITLRNNLRALFLGNDRACAPVVVHVLFPLMAVLPPIGVALGTSSLDLLVGITGSYAGAGIQYVIPAFLVFCSRRTVYSIFENNIENPYVSPFRHRAWILLIIIWAGACIVLVTVHHIITGK